MGFITELWKEYWRDIKSVALPFLKEHHAHTRIIHLSQGSSKLNEAFLYPIYEIEKIVENKLFCRHGEWTQVFYNDHEKVQVVEKNQGSCKFKVGTKVVESLKYDNQMIDDPFEVKGYALSGYILYHLRTGLYYYAPESSDYSKNLVDLWETYENSSNA